MLWLSILLSVEALLLIRVVRRQQKPGTAAINVLGYNTAVHHFYFHFLHTQLFSSFLTSRGHKCRPFSPPVLAFNFHRA